MKGILLFVIVVILSVHNSNGQINVNPNQTAIALAQKLAGQGVAVTNASLHCAARANGFFNCISSNLGLDSGIVLTNGCVATQGGYKGIVGDASIFASNNNGMPGDAMLTPLAGHPTFDACSLEFDVVPNGDTIKFSYVFSSEEYISAVCGSYNDAFAFFISGPGIAGYDNMALVPGTNIPVTINSVNDGFPGANGNIANCTSIGPGAPFTAYYTDNSLGTTLTHEGLTKVLQAKHAVTPCSKYHLKLVIADAGNATYDSGVFLKAGSLATSSYSIRAITQQGRDSTIAFCVKGCAPGKFIVKRTQADTKPQTVRFIKGGDATSGIDYSPIADSVVIPANSTSAQVVVNGLQTASHTAKTLQLYILNNAPCTGTNNISDSAAIVIYDTIHTTTGTNDVAICANDSIQIGVNNEDIFSYTWLPALGLSNPSVKDPTASPPVSTTYTVTISLPGTSCRVKQQEVNVSVKLTPELLPIADTTVCRNTHLTLTALTTAGNAYYSYSWSGPAEFTSTSATTTVSLTDASNAGTYNAVVKIDTNGCTATTSANIYVSIPHVPIVSLPRIYCQNRLGDALNATGENLKWYIPASDTPISFAPVPDARVVGSYKYYVTQTIGTCESLPVEIDVSVKECCSGVVIIPSAFTPNNDGRNDVFRVVTGYGYRIDRFFIFNRWGQEVYSGMDGIWNGTMHGTDADAGTYYYRIVLGCILGGTEVRQGDITLIR